MLWVCCHGDLNHIGGVMVSMLTSSVVDCEYEPPPLGQTKGYEIGICYLITKHTMLIKD